MSSTSSHGQGASGIGSGTTGPTADWVRIDESAARGLEALAARAQHLNPHSLVRFSTQSGEHIDVFMTTPFSVLVSRRARGQVSADGVVMPVADFLRALETGTTKPGTTKSGTAEIGGVNTNAGTPIEFRSIPASWPGALPPRTGFCLLDEIPAAEVLSLADQGRALARQFSGPLGPPKSLVEQTVITVSHPESSARAEVPMRAILALTSFGFIPSWGSTAGPHIPRTLRVSKHQRWVRMDAAYGSVYYFDGLPLLAL